MIRLDAQTRIYERDERGQTVAYIDALRARAENLEVG